jgi:hypothetical protein
VRSNELEELPAAISRLRRLTELNAANNALRWLPFELLELLSCPSRIRILHLHPNPFIEPSESEGGIVPAPPVEAVNDGRTWGSKTCDNPEHDHARHSGWRRRFKCRSQVKFFDSYGTPVKGPSALSARPVSKTPSLLELCVKTWADTPNMPNLAEYTSRPYPEKLQHLLDHSRRLREAEAPGRECTICKRTFVIPRTQWIEWWQIEQSPSGPVASEGLVRPRDVIESQVPFVRRGCSWGCVPAAGDGGGAEAALN